MAFPDDDNDGKQSVFANGSEWMAIFQQAQNIVNEKVKKGWVVDLFTAENGSDPEVGDSNTGSRLQPCAVCWHLTRVKE